MSVDLSIDPQKTTESIIQFIKKTLKKAGFSKLVIGLSGGIDSATSLALGVNALGAENMYVGVFPYGELNKIGTIDAKLITDFFHIPQKNVSIINIKPLVDKFVELHESIEDLRRGNIMARIRMILLYDFSKKYQALVLGTENKTEHLLGYFTRFGDEASDIEPIIGLYKTQVMQLASYLEIPEKIIQKTPTAGMWSGQTDEEEFGFTYEEADQILTLFYDKKFDYESIIKYGFKPEILDKVLKRVHNNSFKRHLPYKFL